MFVELQQGDALTQPLMWQRWDFGPASVPGAVLSCARGHAMSIGGDGRFGSVHTIADNGVVSPSVVCHSCDWHVCVKLIGWQS